MRCANAMAATFVFFRASMSDSQSCLGPHLCLTMICDMAPNRARSERFGLIGVSWFFLSVRSPSPHVALTVRSAVQAAVASGW